MRVKRSHLLCFTQIALVTGLLLGYLAFGPRDEVIGACAALCFIQLTMTWRHWRSPLVFSTWLLALTAIPLAAFLYYGVLPIYPAPIRLQYMQDVYVREALVAVLLATSTLTSFVGFSQGDYHPSNGFSNPGWVDWL